jgi:lipoyl(octanoyl) transferase
MTGRAWRLLRTGAGTPAFNMGLDEALLRGGGAPALRLYAWDPPALSLGWFQPLEGFDLAAVRAAGAVLVRRPSGGGAIHHDRELTFSITAQPGRDGYPEDTVEAYRWVHAALAAALAAVGAPVTPHGGARRSTRPRDATLCFHDHIALDLVDAQGRKVAGSAQRRVDGRVLHHGSLPLLVPRLSPRSGSVALAAGREVGWDELADALAGAFAQALPAPLVAAEVDAAERAEAERLAAEVYAEPRGAWPPPHAPAPHGAREAPPAE